MQLGKALVGGLIGAAVGIGLLLVVYLTLGIDRVWLSIPFALITGLGVRMLVSTSGHASYIRGAMTMLLALAAYIGGWVIVAQIATARANAPTEKPAAAPDVPPLATEPGDAEPNDGEAKDESKDAESAPPATPTPPRKATAQPTESGNMSRSMSPKSMEYGTGDVICLAIAALVAYELGRGSGVGPVVASQPMQPAPAGTHPDA
jgi:hypothetical protein